MSDADEWPEAYELASEAVKQCAESVAEDNPDFDKSQAFAICQDRENRGELSHAPVRVHRDLQFAVDTVRRMESDDGAVTYENIAILAAGEWTDGATEETVYYSPEALEAIAADPEGHVLDNAVNVNHEHSDQLKQVGHFDPDSLAVEDDVLYADITLHRRTQASTDTAELVDLALETKGEQGAGGPSVEIPFEGEQSEFDRDRGMERLTEFNLSGLSIVTHAASEDVAFEEQFADRAVAMSGAAPAVRVMNAGQTALTAGRQPAGMETITELDQLVDYEEATVLDAVDEAEERYLLVDGETVSIDIEGASIEDIRDALSPKQTLQGEDEVAAAVDEYLASEGSPEDGVDQFLQWAQANLDIDMDALEAAAADFVAQADAEDLSETPVSEFAAFLNEQGGEGEGEEPEGGGEEPEEEMSDELSAVKEENRELRAEIDDLANRLESLEDQPDYGTAEAAEAGEDEAVPVDQLGGLTRDGEYISR